MAKTLILTVFLVATFLVISQDVVISEITCNTVSDCLRMVCHTGHPMCLRGVCRCHPEGAVTNDKIRMCNDSSKCVDEKKCTIGFPICVGEACKCGEH
ncbi:hypothetical protein H5410_025149 [Solanum commersonii]|uniref:Uncharacterized protein n=1 Tax=Solanum commersonii TaxID=4109 RepID=A0A9J5YSZ0_SOLCO|nr:hypothetical protein H5410_025149 [Solanum commersonii]